MTAPHPVEHTEHSHHERRTSVCVFGASRDTGNLGVSALATSVIEGIATRLTRPDITVFDNGQGTRSAFLDVGGPPVSYTLRGARIGRRYWRPENLWHMRLSGWGGGIANPGTKTVLRADAVLDISGGDSFSDLYGQQRFNLVALPKLITLRARVPLVLLPQTYGPFSRSRSRRLARRALLGSAMAWARDADSYAAMGELLGSDLDPERHKRGVDVAFLLPMRRPTAPVAEEFAEWLEAEEGPVAGLNVSGLLLGDRRSSRRILLQADYGAGMQELARKLIEGGTRLVLVPHVRGAGAESDDRACQSVLARLRPTARERAMIAPPGLDETETKWLIAQLAWFCGTRMHATIAALSSGVPAAAVAYSSKTRGVFATCGQDAWVADARSVSTADLVEQLWAGWQSRDAIAETLHARLPQVRAAAARQMDEIAAACRAGSG